MKRELADGLYEEVVTLEIDAAIETLHDRRFVQVGELDAADAHVVLARYLAAEVERVLGDLKGDDRLERQLEVSNALLALLVERGLSSTSRYVAPPGRELLALHADERTVPARPRIPLATSNLLTLSHNEPKIGHELRAELDSADRVDALISFVTITGVRFLFDAIERMTRRHREGDPARFRLLTTTYVGATEARAVEQLARLPGVEVKVSYDVDRTRLHAKAWLFHRASGLSTAYVGSANLSHAALTSGLEWNVKLSAGDLPSVIKKFEGAFETLWASDAFQPFDPSRPDDVARLRRALSAESGEVGTVRTFFTLSPHDYQEKILEQLRAEREVHGRTRNLIVAATGTGKTVIAAFDYARRAEASGLRPRLLFLAHRRDLLTQARDTFRHVLHDGSFGSLLGGEHDPDDIDHLFATIQSVRSRDLVTRLGPAYWDHVIVDECHHLPADSYQAIVPSLRPSVLVGLTATPERLDHRSLLADFEGHVAAEIRLWHALQQQMLAPFEYYGVHDGVDASRMDRLRWSRGASYDRRDLDELYTGDHARADLVFAQLGRRIADLRAARALGFCVSVAHAEFMAAHFTARGMPAIALDGGASDDERRDARERLEQRAVNVIFTADLYNEGVDLPFVDTLLLLRPSESATVFLQQLGRGLRLHPRKTTCLVLDFIGQHRRDFRFDAILGAITGVARARLIEEVEADFPFLPSGCTMTLDAVSRETVLGSLRTSVEATWKRLKAEAADVAGRGGPVSLARFLDETGRDLADVYRHGSWSRLRADAGLEPVRPSDAELATADRLRHFLHVDDPARLARLEAAMGDAPPTLPARDALMLGYQIEHESKRLFAAEDVVPWLRSMPPVRDELRALASILADRVALAGDLRPVPEWPLVLHRHYIRREILAACGYWNESRKVPQQQGVLRLKDERRELLFVTLDKSDRGFSPSTRYRDYAISRDRFHWETQNKVAAASDTARRYAEHDGPGGHEIYLFVQTRKDAPFAFLGRVRFARMQGSLPVQIVWRLDHPMPATLFDEYKTLADA